MQSIEEDAFDALNTSMEAVDSTQCEGWQRLDWVVDDYIRQECIAAEERARVIAEDSDDSVMRFEDYGARWIKGEGESRWLQHLCNCSDRRAHSSFIA